MSYRNFGFVFFVIVFLSFASHVSAQQGNSIRGKVRNSLGANLSQVIVTIETGNGAPFGQSATNNEGDFFFGGLTDTSYVLTISMPDYSPVTEHVDFVNRSGPDNPGETRTVFITLTPKNAARSVNGAIFFQNVPKAARDAFELAARQAKDGKSEDALASLQEAIRIFPDYFDAHFALGRELTKESKYSDAIAQLEAARRINPRDDRVYYSFGSVLVQQGKFSVAAAVFAEAARLNPLNPDYPLMRGKALISHAGSIDPSQPKNAAARTDALTEAETSIKKAYELSGKKLAMAHLLLASVYEKRGERSRAADELEQYLREVPNAQNADAIRDGIKKLRSSR